ncbi:MAG: alpha/beta hydrolase, partial [Chitinophagaceae bacterium]
GVAAFVLKYRLPDSKTDKNPSISPLQDAQQAMKIVRDSAGAWGLDKNKIGIMGFSAGGHLAASVAVHYKDALIAPGTTTSLRPDFQILVYPVISFGPEFGHRGSRDNLLGTWAGKEAVTYYSNELQVTKQTPPAFLVHAGDDKVVPVANSLSYYSALLKQGIPSDLHVYAHGGHGFGATPGFDEWFGRCGQWMRASGWIGR